MAMGLYAAQAKSAPAPAMQKNRTGHRADQHQATDKAQGDEDACFHDSLILG